MHLQIWHVVKSHHTTPHHTGILASTRLQRGVEFKPTLRLESSLACVACSWRRADDRVLTPSPSSSSPSSSSSLSPATATYQSLQDAVTGFAQQRSLNPKAYIVFKANNLLEQETGCSRSGRVYSLFSGYLSPAKRGSMSTEAKLVSRPDYANGSFSKDAYDSASGRWSCAIGR